MSLRSWDRLQNGTTLRPQVRRANEGEALQIMLLPFHKIPSELSVIRVILLLPSTSDPPLVSSMTSTSSHSTDKLVPAATTTIGSIWSMTKYHPPKPSNSEKTNRLKENRFRLCARKPFILIIPKYQKRKTHYINKFLKEDATLVTMHQSSLSLRSCSPKSKFKLSRKSLKSVTPQTWSLWWLAWFNLSSVSTTALYLRPFHALLPQRSREYPPNKRINCWPDTTLGPRQRSPFTHTSVD